MATKRKPIVLTKKDHLKKMQDAFKKGRLIAQKERNGLCAMRSDAGNPCIIGAALTAAQARRCDNHRGSITTLVVDGVIKVRNPEWWEALQAAHDDWSTYGSEADGEKLRDLLGLPKSTPIYPKGSPYEEVA